MAKVGYIFEANSYDAFDADKEWMRQYGCVQVVEESVGHETLRPRWKQLMSNLERGDELVMSKFSNAVRGLRELSALIELCRIKVVRIISIHDKIDTDNKLFPDTTPAEVLAMFGALPEEVAVLRKSSDKIIRLQQSISIPISKKSMSKTERDKKIVDMYNNGYSIRDIWKESGVQSKSTLYSILNKYNFYKNLWESGSITLDGSGKAQMTYVRLKNIPAAPAAMERKVFNFGTESDPDWDTYTLITEAQQFVDIGADKAKWNQNYVLGNDIDLESRTDVKIIENYYGKFRETDIP